VVTEVGNAGTDLVQSSVTFTLGANIENLTLTGAAAINGTGNGLANTITGNSAANTLSGQAGIDFLIGGDGNDLLIGGADADILTGGSGIDTFRCVLADSLLAAYDRITDLAIGTDVIDGPNAVAAARINKLGAVSALSELAISSVLTSSTFVSNGASIFTFVDTSGTRTFLALNDAIAGYNSVTDCLLEISGFSGSIGNLSVV
jgi:Ca2+-binding RTX toxin-like protein